MKGIHLAGLVLAAVATGCTHTYVASEYDFESDKIAEFSTQATVGLINGQPDTQKVLFATNTGSKFFADLNAWTDTAIMNTARELTRRGARRSGGAEKTLTLSVESARVTTGAWGFRGYVDLRVTTGGGYEATYQGEAGSSVTLYRAADGALARAVVQMLNDSRIVAYLAN
jgi:hypothetical protein